MKDNFRFIRVSTIGKFLPNIERRYLVKQFSSDEVFIQYEPSFYYGHLSEISDLLCYDFDDLAVSLQEKYQNDIENYTKIEGNLYKVGEVIDILDKNKKK
jgi:hypothetical protein